MPSSKAVRFQRRGQRGMLGYQYAEMEAPLNGPFVPSNSAHSWYA
jgi:hypothetical protein